jgi:hypothetical protein
MRIGEVHNKDDLISALKTAVNDRQEKRRPYEAIWWNNIALVAGDHYLKYDPTRAIFAERDAAFDTSEKKPRMVVNQALSVFRTELAKLTKNHPIVEVMANSDEAEDLAATKVGRAVLSAVEWKFKLPSNRKEILSWVIQCGVGAHYIGWDYLNSDPGEFEFTIDPETGEPAFSAERIREIKDEASEHDREPVVEKYPLGDVDFKVYGPFQLLPSDFASNFNQLRDIITTEVADIDVVRDMYGRVADGLNPDQVTLGPMEERLLSRVGLSHPRNQAADNSVEVYTFWLLPNVYRKNKFLQAGLYVRWAQDKILEVSEFPFDDARMPFAFYQHIPAPTSIWPDCVVNHIRELNLEIDKTISQLVESKDFMSNPMWRVASQHRIKGEIKNVAGSILKYVHSPNVPPPEPIPGLQMPSQIENLVQLMRNQILEISGQSDISRGSVPTGVRSGTAVAYLQEEDDTKIAPTVSNLEDAIAYEGSLILSRVSQYYHTRRIMRFYRADGEFDVVKFKGADLKNNTDVVCQAGSAMPKSKAAREANVLQLVQLGVLTDPRKIQDQLDMGAAEPNLEDLQIAMANRENNLMLEGMAMATYDVRGDLAPAKNAPVAVPVFKWHNHKVHLDRHYSFMSGEEFDRLRVTHPEIARLFDEHTAEHETQMAAQQQEQMAMLEAAKGAPGGQPAGQQPTSAFTAPQAGATSGAEGTAAPDQPTADQPQPSQDGSGQITHA